MLDFIGMHFNAKKSLYINFNNYASIFCKATIIRINGEGQVRCYVLPTSVCTTIINDFPIEDRYSGLICQHALENILNVSQRVIKSLYKPTKSHIIVGNFPNRKKGNKEAYDSIDYFLH